MLSVTLIFGAIPLIVYTNTFAKNAIPNVSPLTNNNNMYLINVYKTSINHFLVESYEICPN